MNAEKPAFNEGEHFQGLIGEVSRKIFPSGFCILKIITHLNGHFMGRWRRPVADGHRDVTPASCPVRNKGGGDLAVNVQQEGFVKWDIVVVPLVDRRLDGFDLASNQRGQLGVTQDALRCFNIAGGSIRAWCS